MFRKVGARWVLGIASAMSLAGGAAHAAAIPVVGNSIFVSAANPSGTSFVYDGTITSGSTMSFEVTGQSFLQADPDQYGTNAAGIVTTAGYFAGENVGSAKLVAGSKLTLGALVIEVNGFGPVVFKPDATNGLGSSNPSHTLVFTGVISKLFGNITPVNDPTFTFLVADEGNMYFDNSGGFTVTQLPSSVPVPAAAWQSLAGVAGVALIVGRKKLSALAMAVR